MKTGDLQPAWVLDLASKDTSTDLTLVTSWKLEAWRETVDGKVAAFTDTGVVVVPAPGAKYTAVATHQWQTGQTDVAGVLHGVVVATWPDGDEQSFPSEGDASILLEDKP